MLQTYQIPAGGRIVNAKASFFRYESAVAGGGDESLRVRADGNDLGTYLPGDAITLPVDAKNWEVTPVTAGATAIVRLGVGGVESSRIFGTVQVIDTAFNKVVSDVEFMSSISLSAGGAGFYTSGEIWNGTTDKGLIVRGLQLVTDTAQTITLAGATAEMASPTTTTGVQSKRMTAVGITTPANIRRNSKTNGGAPDTAGTALLVNVAMTGAVIRDVPLQGFPIVIGPGSGLRIACTAANSTLQAILNIGQFTWTG